LYTFITKKTKPRFVTWANYEDIEATVVYMNKLFPNAPLFLQGISMGAAFLQKFAGTKAQLGERLPVTAIGCIASPFDLDKAVTKASENKILSKGLTSLMKQSFKEHLHEPLFLEMLKEKNICPNEVLSATTCQEYNTRFSCKLGGYKDIVEYHHKVSSYPVVKHINIPTLCINATDDPIIP